MNESTDKPAFPAARMLTYVTLAVVVVGAANALILPGVFGGRDGIVTGAVFTAAIVLISGILCVIPLCRAQHSGQIVGAFLLGMLIRMSCGAIGAWIAIGVMSLPGIPVAACLMLAYLPALFIETRFIIRHVPPLDAWHQRTQGDARAADTASAGQDGHTAHADPRSEKLA